MAMIMTASFTTEDDNAVEKKNCTAFHCLDRDACFAYDDEGKTTRWMHHREHCDHHVDNTQHTVQYLHRDGTLERKSIEDAEMLMQCTYASKLLFRNARMLLNYPFWGFSHTDGIDHFPLSDARISSKVAIAHVLSLSGHSGEDNGLGLFALEPLAEDSFLGEYAGLLQAEADTSKAFDPYGLSYPSVFDGGQLYVSAFEFGNEMRCINHSLEPNARFRPMLHHGILRLYCFTIRAIDAGEQILVDYGPTYWTAGSMAPIAL